MTVPAEGSSSVGVSISHWSHLKRQLPYIGTLAVLAGFGAMGHSFHWAVPGLQSSDVSNREAELSSKGSNEGSIDSSQQSATRIEAVSATGETASSPTPIDPIIFRSAQSVKLSGIDVEEVGVHYLTKGVSASAEVQYDRRNTIDLSSRVAGVIHRVLCHWGQKVTAGEILAVVEAGEVGRLKSEFAKTLSERNLKQTTLDRYRTAGGAIPQAQVLEAEGALQVATVALLSAEQALVNLGFQLKLEDFSDLPEREVIRRLRTLGFEGELLTSIEQTSSSSNLLPILAPIDGVIIGNDAAIGESVNSERAFMQVSDISRVWVVLNIRKEDAASIRLGQNVEFSPDGFDLPVQGAVSWISTEVDEKTRTLKVRAEVANPQLNGSDPLTIDVYALRANMYGVAKVEIRKKATLAVSKACLHHDDGQTLVFVQTASDTFEPRAVTCGVSEDRMVELIGPVVAGNKVASRGSQLLKSELVLARSLRGE